MCDGMKKMAKTITPPKDMIFKFELIYEHRERLKEED